MGPPLKVLVLLCGGTLAAPARERAIGRLLDLGPRVEEIARIEIEQVREIMGHNCVGGINKARRIY